MRNGWAALLLGAAVSFACGSGDDGSSDDGDSNAEGGSSGSMSPTGGALTGGTTSTGGTSPSGGSTSGAGSGAASGAGVSGDAGGGSGGQSGTESGGSGGSGAGGTGGSDGLRCDANETACVCGPVSNPTLADCGTSWTCCFTYVSQSDDMDADVCYCQNASETECTEGVASLYMGHREARCPP